MDLSEVAALLNGTIMFAIPLLLVALGGMFSERSGVINIALEGVMVVGALISYLFMSKVSGSAWAIANPQLMVLLAVLISAFAGGLFSLLLAFASIHLKADQTISGTSLNMVAPAFAVVLTWAIQGQGQTTIYSPSNINITPEMLGLSMGIKDSFFGIMIFRGLNLTIPIALILWIVSYVLLKKTKFGLRLRSCGEHPQAADSVGINVYKMRYFGVALSGILAGIGGLSYTLATGSGFVGTVLGYGFLALAVMIFGNWNPLRIMAAALFFAFFKVISGMATEISFLPKFEGVQDVQYIYQMLPYIVTLVVLAFTSKKSRAPKAEGIPYDKSTR
ncbi:MAG: ABC transporter permease [Clostridia bacterium]